MKKYLFSALLALATGAAISQTDEPFLTKQIDKSTFKEMKVATSGGFINVFGVDGDARVEVFVAPNNRNEKLNREEIAARLADKFELKVEVEGNKLMVIAKPKQRVNNWKKMLSISFKIYVPKSVSSDLNTSGGGIYISDLAGGTQDFSTSGGSLTVLRVEGTVKGRTSGGSIDVQECGGDVKLSTSGGGIKAKVCKGTIDLSTSGGSITLEQLKGKIEVSTSGGSIHVDEIKGELSASTSGGSLDMKRLACSLDASTSGGQIKVAFTSLDKYIKLRNSGGNISMQLPKGKGLDLDLSGNRVNTGKLENFSGHIENNNINGKMNGGGSLVYARSSSGRISVDFD